MDRSIFVKRLRAHNSILLFLGFAVASVLLTRLYLDLFDYPQIAKGDIHLAHALWGGLFLVLANVILLAFHGKPIVRLSAVLGGIGFGQLIDEIGKFITKDNNYFYRPVPALIYICFIGLFLVYRYLSKTTKENAKTRVFETLEYLENVADNNFTYLEKRRMGKVLRELAKEKQDHVRRFAMMMLDDLHTIPTVQKKHESVFITVLRKAFHFFGTYTTQKTFVFRAVLVVMGTYVVTGALATISVGRLILSPSSIAILQQQLEASLTMFIGQAVSQIIAGYFFIRGFWLLSRNKVKSIEAFRVGLMITILVTHVFFFYFEQFSAVIGLLFTILVYLCLTTIHEYELTEEAREESEK